MDILRQGRSKLKLRVLDRWPAKRSGVRLIHLVIGCGKEPTSLTGSTSPRGDGRRDRGTYGALAPTRLDWLSGGIDLDDSVPVSKIFADFFGPSRGSACGSCLLGAD